MYAKEKDEFLLLAFRLQFLIKMFDKIMTSHCSQMHQCVDVSVSFPVILTYC